jgi:rubrerythrin
VSENAAAAVYCLAAAERAVLDGRFNLAKVLRACAHSARLRALTGARRLARDMQPAEVLASALALVERQSRDSKSAETLPAEEHHPAAVGRGPFDAGSASVTLGAILRRALMSLERNRDVLESDVAQSLWGCQVCGAILEGSAPESCSRCGALGFEFEWFGPFYGGTPERLGRRTPGEIAAILQDCPLRLARLLDGVGEERLAARPSPDEWGIKEIAGHLIDVTELFSWRVRTIRDAVTPPSLDRPMPPWRLLEGKGYPGVASTAILAGFRSATREALELVEGMEDWGRFGHIRGRGATMLDLGTWLANHNIAHLAQIEALRGSPR